MMFNRLTFIRDEVLVAYVDGTLGREDGRIVERLLEIDVRARQSLYLFSLTRHHVQRLSAEADCDVLPRRVLALFELACKASTNNPSGEARTVWTGVLAGGLGLGLGALSGLTLALCLIAGSDHSSGPLAIDLDVQSAVELHPFARATEAERS